MSDQQIECVECGRSFIWSAGEQRFYAERGFQPPKHCPDCRARRGVSRTGTLVYGWLGGVLGLALFLTVVLASIGMDGILAWLIVMTLSTLVVYAYDKSIAGSETTRVPERVLLLLALFGGTLGALVGMKVFRHKTAKESFQAKLVVVLVVQIVLVVVYFYFVASTLH